MGRGAASISATTFCVAVALVLLSGCGAQNHPGSGSAADPAATRTTAGATPSPSSAPATSAPFTPAPIPDPGRARAYPTCGAARTAYTGLRAAGLRLAHQGRMPRSAAQGIAAARLVVANPTCFPAQQVTLAGRFRASALNTVPAGVSAMKPACRQPYLDILHLLQFSAGIASSSHQRVDLGDGIDAISRRHPGCFGPGDIADMKQVLAQQQQLP